MRLSKIRTKATAFVLALVMLFMSLPMEGYSLAMESNTAGESTLAPNDDHATVTVLHNGAKKSYVDLAEDGKEILTSLVIDKRVTNRTWQILVPGENKWVNINGCNGETLAVSYAMVGSMLDADGNAYIRSSVVADGETYLSDSVGISVVYNTAEKPVEAPAYLNSLKAAEDIPDLETFTIVINYIFDNGTIAFESYGASVAKGSSFHKVVNSPTVTGYEPFRRIDNAYVRADSVELNLENISSNVTINVIYQPAIVEFEVHHHLQDIDDDAYSAKPDYTTKHQALTGTVVGDDLAMTEEELPGFKALAYEKLTVAADGSTVVEIRYDRNYYLINFDMQGGYGVEPFYVRYETVVGANVPTRHGYVFDGWELVSYGGNTPTAIEASKYDINSRTITTPDANLTYRARWITQLTEYTMVFWKENIEDNGFTYWGFLDGLTAMSDTYVDGADRINEVGGIEDEDCFTYNDALTDKHVLVEGDGSTVVNVYYTRNRYSITFKAPGLCAIPEKHQHSDACYDLVCGKAHIHTDECNKELVCTEPEHASHDDSCIICGKDYHVHSSACCGYEDHEHSVDCYSDVGNSSNPSNAPEGVEDGYIFAVRSLWRYNYHIYIKGQWYSYSGSGVSSGDIIDPDCGHVEHAHGSADCPCKLEVHAHVESCYKDVLHTHDADECYSYSCNAVAHVHTDGCYILDCSIPTGHSHNNTCKRATSTNTVKIAHYKYQANLEDMWPVTDDNGKTYDSGQRWSPSNSDTYSAVLVYIANMPGESFTLTLNESSNDTYTMNYYLEVLPGESYDVTYQNKYFIYYTQVKANYNYITKAEDFFEINGYYKFASNPAFKNDQIDINGGGVVNFYYGRIVDHYLQFQSNGVILNSHTQHGIPYGHSLKEYDFIPPYPDSLEPGAFVFGGWYTSPGHYKGTEVNWDTLTMDSGDVLLYAKWTPVVHSLDVYFDNTLTEKVGNTQFVQHGNFATAPTETITNGAYIFQGWFYSDVIDGVVVEKAFVFTGIPIIRDLKIYAKWSSHVTVNYEINYVLKETGEKIADPTIGSSMAGHNKTFYAKAGNDLYANFREGYYPLTSSHTIMMNPEDGDKLVYSFEYVYVESMPYAVRYVDEAGNPVATERKVLDNNLSVVTETFVKIDKMMPDAYQKRLVLSATGQDEDNDGIYDENVIIFNYTADEEHAYYKVVYYIEHIGGDGYREYRSEDSVGIIGKEYQIPLIALTGFSYNAAKTTVNGAYAPTVNDSVTAKLTSDGLLIELYYDRVDVDYVVRYIDSKTNLPLYEEKRSKGIFGEQIVEHAVGLSHLGYNLVSDSVKTHLLSMDAELNVIEFYYEESSYALKYQIVGSPEGGQLSLMSENVSAVSGIPTGSMPMVYTGYHFVGWFLDANCEKPVPAEWVNASNNEIIPESGGVWLASHTYYAKIDPDFTSLRITTVGCSDVDDGQVFIFRIKGTSELTDHLDFYVTVVGNSTVTVVNLPIGSFTVTAVSDWSYRYTPDSVTKSITLSVVASNNSIAFSNIRTGTKWLDGNSSQVYKNN